MTQEELKAVFAKGVKIKAPDGSLMGLCRPERDLIAEGFEKRELRKLERQGLLKKMHARAETKRIGGIEPLTSVYVLEAAPEEKEASKSQGQN